MTLRQNNKGTDKECKYYVKLDLNIDWDKYKVYFTVVEWCDQTRFICSTNYEAGELKEALEHFNTVTNKYEEEYNSKD